MVKSYNIAVMGGDGTGPEVVAEGLKVINAAEAKYGFKLNLTKYDFGGERYMKTGETIPDSAIEEFRKFDSIFAACFNTSFSKVDRAVFEHFFVFLHFCF